GQLPSPHALSTRSASGTRIPAFPTAGRSRTGTTPTPARDLVNCDAGARQVALQRPFDLLAWSDHERVGRVIIRRSHRVTAELDQAGGAEPPAGDDEGRGLHRGGQSDPVSHPVMQHVDNDVVPVVVLYHQGDL